MSSVSGGLEINLLSEARDDHRHVVRLFGSARPLFRGGEQRVHHRLGTVVPEAKGDIFQPARAEFLAVNVFRLYESVAENHERTSRLDLNLALLIIVLIEDAHDGAADFQVLHLISADAQRRGMAGVGISQLARGGIVDREKESGEAIVRR